jgi:NAD-dependent deacetylase
VDDAPARARALLAAARRVVVFTGAGVSAESGVPTFRGAGGLWQQLRPEELATPEAFARDPRLVWEWYEWRRGLIRACRPNAAHVAIAAWMARTPGGTLVTQNVDDLHERAAREAGAGLDGPPRLLKLHGSIFDVRCRRCGHTARRDEPVDASRLGSLPVCPACDWTLGPGVVWFGEQLPAAALTSAYRAAAACQVCLVVGTAGAVYPAAGVVHEAEAAGAAIVVVDPGETGFDEGAAVRFRAAAGAMLPALLAAG